MHDSDVRESESYQTDKQFRRRKRSNHLLHLTTAINNGKRGPTNQPGFRRNLGCEKGI
jgi:hypothetical protein